MNGVVNIKGKDYKTVALRVSEFREQCPIAHGWSIQTEIVSINETSVIVKASIVNDKGQVVGTGHGHERWDANQINETSCVENCETSAIGRALAASGFGGSEFASANEVENAVHQQLAKKTPAKKAAPSEWDTYCDWVNKTFSKAVKEGEPWESWDEIDLFVGTLHEILEPAGLTRTVDGEVVCDWDKLRACHDGGVFRAICKALKDEAARKMGDAFI